MRKYALSIIPLICCLVQAAAQVDGYLVENFRVEDGLSSNITYGLMLDSEGYLWIGGQGAVNRYDGVEFKVYGLPGHTGVTEIVQEKDGTIIARYNGTAYCLDRSRDCFTEYADKDYFIRTAYRIPGISSNERCTRIGRWIFSGEKEKAIVYDTESDRVLTPDWTAVRGATRSRDGDIWLATNNGIYIVDDSLNVLKHITKIAADKYALHDNALKDIVSDRFGGIWVSSYFEGIYHFSINEGDIIRYNSILEGYPNWRVRNIVEDRDGIIWLGTEDRGLIRYDKNRDRYSRIKLPTSSSNIIGLHCENDSLWIKSYDPDHEFLRMHIRSLQCENINSMPAGYNEYGVTALNRQFTSLKGFGKFYACTSDDMGNRWVTSSLGLLCIGDGPDAVHFFSQRDGLQFSNFNYSSILYASDSLMYAGTTDGFVTFNPRKMLAEADSADIKVSGIRKKDGLLRIPHKDNSLDINAVTLEYRTPRRIWLQYRVDGISGSWADVKDGHIMLGNLKTGRYSLKIRALTGNGSKVLALWQQDFKILPPPYLSAWAILLYIIICLTLIILAIRVISRNAIMKSKVALAGKIAQEIRHPFALAQIQMETLLEHFRLSPDSSAKKDLNEMAGNLEKINLMIDNLTELRSKESVNSFLSGKKIEQTTTLPDITAFDATILIVTAADDIFNFFCSMLRGGFNLIRANTDDEAMVQLETQKISLILVDSGNEDEISKDIELCRSIKKNSATAHKPVILLTSNYDISSRVYALSCGADSYLVKPLSRDILVATITNLLDNRNAIRRHYSENPAINTVQLENRAPDNVLMRNIHEFIYRNIGNADLKVEDVAIANNVSLSKLQKKMKTILNVSPAQYILSLRLKKAEELLKDRNISIEEISRKTGFASHSYFTSCFRKHYGCTPMQYRGS